MTDDRVPDHLQRLWRDQPAQGRAMSLDELRHRSQRLTRTVRRRNLREYVAAAVVVIACGLMLWKAPLPPMVRVGGVLMIVAVIFVVYHLHRYGAARPMPEEMALTTCLAFHRGELERQRDLLRGVWKWYVLPFAPSLILIYLGSALAHPERTSAAVWGATATLVISIVVAELNRFGARRIQARIDALERTL